MAVWPIMFLSVVVSWLPGASISTRFGPCCWMTVSLVPIALMRRFKHFDRLPDRVTHLVGGGRVGQRQPNAVGALRHVERAAVSARERAADRLAQRLQKLERLGALARVGDPDHDRARLDRDAAGDRDLALAQLLPHVVAQRLDLALDHRGGVDLHQQVGAALQIEAKHDLAQRNEAGEPRGKRVDRLSRHKARQDH